MNNSFEEWGSCIVFAILLILFFIVSAGIALMKAQFVYHDWRCAYAECRIEIGK